MFFACSFPSRRFGFKLTIFTLHPNLARRTAAIFPTEPVPKIAQFLSFNSPSLLDTSALSAFATIAAAVVYAPAGSTIMLVLNGGNIEFFTAL